MLEDALSYPTNGESGLARVLIGAVLGVLGVLILPAFIVYGYLVRSMAACSRGEAEPPAFEGWDDLLVVGIKATVVGVAYALVPLVLMFLVVSAIGLGATAETATAAGLLASVGLLGFVGVIVLLFFIQYALPAALTNLAREDRLGAAFDFDTLVPVLTSGTYIKAAVLTFVVALGGGIAFGVFSVITLGVGYLLAPFFYFWLYLAGSYLFGTAFGNVVGTDPEPETPGGGEHRGAV